MVQLEFSFRKSSTISVSALVIKAKQGVEQIHWSRISRDYHVLSLCGFDFRLWLILFLWLLSPKLMTGDVQMWGWGRGGVFWFIFWFFFFNPNETFRSSESSYKSLKPAWTIPNVYSSLNNGTYYAKLCHYWEENFDHPILNYSSERHSDHYHYWPRNSSYILCQISMYPRPLNTLFFHSPLCEAVLMHKDP